MNRLNLTNTDTSTQRKRVCHIRANILAWAPCLYLREFPPIVKRTQTRARLAVCLAIAVCCITQNVATARSGVEIDFNRDVRPILSDKCFQCHGPDATHREADLRLDTEESAKADRGGYSAVSGDRATSELVTRITADDEDMRMPPATSGKTLSSDERDVLLRWIDQGAPWAQHWAYVQPRSHPTPRVGDSTWPNVWIDCFLLQKMEAEGLTPAADADPITLVRRLHFDLIGLPPALDVVDRFVADPGSSAYQHLVDQLLASPHFGERMAMYWLDLVRYADTVGYHGDQEHNISPYRDYVIDSFNQNMPFDQFTREQLAGDLLPNPTTEQKVASGYNRLLQTSHEGGVQPKEYLTIYAADRVRNVSATWMGATLGCAQCHDHKYDPYLAKDFYSMAAFFADIDEAEHFRVGSDTIPTKRPPEIMVLDPGDRQRKEKLARRVADLRDQFAQATGAVKESLRQQIIQVESDIRRIDMTKRKTMITVALAEPRVTRILPRGNWLDESGPVVQPAIPVFMGQLPAGDPISTRLDLANWLTDPIHGAGTLTARVFVNRLWFLFFGQGLSRTLDDFGGQGEPPSHPELLDRLALEFVASGWDVRHMIRLMLLSRAYQQSSVANIAQRRLDPQNRLLARQARYRLPAEMVRDNALAVSGLLVTELGGRSIRPYQPADYYRHLNFPKRRYREDQGPQQWRRGVYMHWQRQFLHPMLRAMDAPSREECTAQRPRSNTPLAALTLLNDPSFVEAARALAGRLLEDSPSSTDAERIDLAMRLVASRHADAVEREQLLALLNESRREYSVDPKSADELTSVGQLKHLAGPDLVELASWTQVNRALLNLHEVMTRN